MPSINVDLTDEEFKELSDCKPKGETWKEYLQSSAWIKARLCLEPKPDWSSWEQEGKREKPCHSCGYCPYGQVVEMFPLKVHRDEFSCTVFGHNCPAFYLAEPLTE